MTTLQGATPNGSVRRWQRRSAIHHLVPSRPAGHATWSNSGISGGGGGSLAGRAPFPRLAPRSSGAGPPTRRGIRVSRIILRSRNALAAILKRRLPALMLPGRLVVPPASRRSISRIANLRLSSKSFSIPSSLAAGVSWFVRKRMVCSIEESPTV
jgi:hypothetical protein